MSERVIVVTQREQLLKVFKQSREGRKAYADWLASSPWERHELTVRTARVHE
jgi:hypothetical protein